MKKAMMAGMGTLGVIALMMTMTLKAGATEKAVESVTGKVALTTSVEAMTLSVTVETLIAKWAMEKALSRPEELAVMKEPIENMAKPDILGKKQRVRSGTWFEVSVIGSPSNPENFEVTNEGEATPECEEEVDICEIELDTTGIPSGTLTALLNRIAINDYPTVGEFIDAGAIYTGAGDTPVYSYRNSAH